MVHLPTAFRSTGKPVRSVPSHRGNGARSSRRSESARTATLTPDPSAAGATNPDSPGVKPPPGSSSATGGSSSTDAPSRATSGSWTKSTSSRPVRAMATTVSGEPMNENVSALPSLRRGKFRLNDDTMVLRSPVSMSSRFHWPMQGPQALASTVAPMASRSSSSPSRSMVARTCSEPGVTSSGALTRSPAAVAWRAMSAARPMSSYDEFVHEPTSAQETSSG